MKKKEFSIQEMRKKIEFAVETILMAEAQANSTSRQPEAEKYSSGAREFTFKKTETPSFNLKPLFDLKFQYSYVIPGVSAPTVQRKFVPLPANKVVDLFNADEKNLALHVKESLTMVEDAFQTITGNILEKNKESKTALLNFFKSMGATVKEPSKIEEVEIKFGNLRQFFKIQVRVNTTFVYETLLGIEKILQDLERPDLDQLKNRVSEAINELTLTEKPFFSFSTTEKPPLDADWELADKEIICRELIRKQDYYFKG